MGSSQVVSEQFSVVSVRSEFELGGVMVPIM